jgi:hypothetical protein
MRAPADLLAFYEERASSTTLWAATHRANGNWPATLQDYDQAAKNRFFRALVGWRTGLLPPVRELRATLDVSDVAVDFLETTDVGTLRGMFDPVPGAYSAILLDERDSPVVAEARRLAVQATPPGVTVDRTLEGWLVAALVRQDHGVGPEIAAKLQGRKRTALVGETYSTYFELAGMTRASLSGATALTRHALELFEWRKRDPYYSGGVHYEGGDMYNEVVIDFHLAAIWQVRGWDPAVLSPQERLHVQMPSPPPGR